MSLLPADLQHIVREITSATTVREPSNHGLSHWHRVAGYGQMLSEKEDIDERIILLFAYFHDCQRLSEGTDPHHGDRAADYLSRFGSEALDLSEGDKERLEFACRFHTYEQPTDDLTIQACWDADRLDLWRVGITPDPKRLFTRTAKQIAACTYT